MQSIKPIWTEDYKILLNHTYSNRKVRLSSYLTFFQESAWHHAFNMGFGFEDANETGLWWVLIKLHIEVNKLASWGDTVHAKTWPVGMEKILARRDFTLWAADGNNLACGASWWLILEKSSRRPASPEIVKSHLHLVTPVHAVEAKPEKIAIPENLTPVSSHLVNFSEIDIHQHVNNTYFPEWAFNALGSQWILGHTVKSVDIDFTNEAFEGDLIEFFSGSVGDNQVFFKGIRQQDNKEIFKLKISVMT